MSSEIIKHDHKHFLPAAGHDLLLPLYDPFVSLLGGDRARQELVDQGNVKPNHRILDIGCGTGTLLMLLKRRYPAAQVVGLDPDPKALSRADKKARRAAVSVKLDRGFADKLPYEADSFDRVFSSFMFHHLEEEDREKTLSEILRVLKPGGSFHLVDFAVAGDISHGHLSCLLHASDRLKDNAPTRIIQLMQSAGFKEATKLKNGSMLFGLLRTAYYRASG